MWNLCHPVFFEYSDHHNVTKVNSTSSKKICMAIKIQVIKVSNKWSYFAKKIIEYYQSSWNRNLVKILISNISNKIDRPAVLSMLKIDLES